MGEDSKITDSELIEYVTSYVAEFNKKVAAGYKHYPYTTLIESSGEPPVLPKIIQ